MVKDVIEAMEKSGFNNFKNEIDDLLMNIEKNDVLNNNKKNKENNENDNEINNENDNENKNEDLEDEIKNVFDENNKIKKIEKNL
jgi:hypothetical protein